MRKAEVKMHNIPAGILEELLFNKNYKFYYYPIYNGNPISLTMPVKEKEFFFDNFPPFFDGLLPEGIQLDGLLKQCKIDSNDYFSQIITVGQDLVGAVTIEEIL